MTSMQTEAFAECPIGSCTWTLDQSAPTGGERRFFDSAAELFAEYAKVADGIIRAHLETHTLEEWVREVMRLCGELAKAAAPGTPAGDFSRQFTLQQQARDLGRAVITGGSGWRGSYCGMVPATYPEGSRVARRDSWQCHHEHPDDVSAMECALAEVRRLAAGGAYEPCTAGPECQDEFCQRDWARIAR